MTENFSGKRKLDFHSFEGSGVALHLHLRRVPQSIASVINFMFCYTVLMIYSGLFSKHGIIYSSHAR